jgi:hypothetical protein
MDLSTPAERGSSSRASLRRGFGCNGVAVGVGDERENREEVGNAVIGGLSAALERIRAGCTPSGEGCFRILRANGKGICGAVSTVLPLEAASELGNTIL